MRERLIRRYLPALEMEGVEVSAPEPFDCCPSESEGKLVVLLIHRRQLYRDCLATAISEFSGGIDVISVSDARDTNVSHSSATVCVLAAAIDLRPRSRFAAGLSHLLATLPNTPVVVLADEVAGTIEILGALNQGVRGYLQSDLELGIIVEAIRSVSRGGIFVRGEPVPPGEHAIAGINAIASSAPRGCANSPLTIKANSKAITPRELDVLKRLCEGKPNKIIAYELELSPYTIKAYVQSIMRKVGATNRTQLSFLMRSLVNHTSSELGDAVESGRSGLDRPVSAAGVADHPRPAEGFAGTDI